MAFTLRSKKKTKEKPAPHTQKEREAREADRAERAEARHDPDSRLNIAMPYIFIALAVFFGLCLYTGGCGFLGDVVRYLFLSLFSYAAYIFPAVLFFGGITWRRAIREHTLLRRTVFATIALLLILALVYVVTLPADVLAGTVPREEVALEAEVYFSYEAPTAQRGGFLGALMGWVLFRLVGPVMTIVLAALAVLLYGIFGFGFSPDAIVTGIIRRAQGATKRTVDALDEIEPVPVTEEAEPPLPITPLPAAEERVAEEPPAETAVPDAVTAPSAAPRSFADIFVATGGTREGTPPPAPKPEMSEEELRAYRARVLRDRMRADDAIHSYPVAELRPSTITEPEEPLPAAETAPRESAAPTMPEATPEANETVRTRTMEDFRRITVSEPVRVYTPHTPSPAVTVEEAPPAEEKVATTSPVPVVSVPVTPPAPPPQSAETPAPAPAPAPTSVPASAPAAIPVAEEDAAAVTEVTENGVPTDRAASLVTEMKPAAAPPAQMKKTITYQYPPISLLNVPALDQEADQEEIQRVADTLVRTFESFGIPITITGYSRGPRITRYEFVQKAGIRVSKVASYADDITQKLSTQGVRIEAPIPNQSSIGVEVPNRKAPPVRIRSLIDTDTFRDAESKTTVVIGSDVTGKPIFFDLSKAPHMLIAGATGMGKSVCINAIIVSLLYKASPDDVRLILIDPKKVEFGIYGKVPHLLVPVVTDPNKAAGALNWAVNEMERRYDLIESVQLRDIKGYNAYCVAEGLPTLPKIVIIIDELNDLMMSARKIVEASICRIAQKARAAGIHLLIGTQRPSVNVITGDIKVNIPARISFRVNQRVDSSTILDMAGAEKLLPNGDMLFSPTGTPQRVQGAFVEDLEVRSVVNFLAEAYGETEYDEGILADIDKEAAKCAQKTGYGADEDDDDDTSAADGIYEDPKFEQALDVVFSAGSISTSMLQRKIGIGFGRAARFIDAMCEMGIVGEARGGSKPRELLISRAEYEERKLRLDD